MSLAIKEACARCKPIVDRAHKNAYSRGRIDGMAEAMKTVSVLVTETPEEFVRELPREVRERLLTALERERDR